MDVQTRFGLFWPNPTSAISLGALRRMPFKHNLNRRHKYLKAWYKVTNWTAYNEALRNRGDVTIWFTEDAIAN